MKKFATIVCSRRFDVRLSSLPINAQEAIERALCDLAVRLDTFPHQKLRGVEAYKLRVGNYRVVYDFNRSEGRIDALTVGDRKDIYERFL